jgi:hypothetical protein
VISKQVKALFGLWVVFIYLILVACAGPAADPTPTPAAPTAAPPTATLAPASTDPPAGEPFTSERFGYSLLVPPGWLFRDRPGEWPDFDPVDPRRGTGIDTFAAYLDGRNLALGIGARPLAEGDTLESWSETAQRLILESVGEGVCHETNEAEPAPAEPLTLAGEPALLLAYQCPQSYDNYGLVALAIHDGNGYWLTWLGPQGNEAGDRATFLALLDSFSFGE